MDVPYAEIVFDSLLNVVLGYDPIGWGVPYGGVFSTDTAKPLMEVAAQVLIVLLDFGFPIRTQETPTSVSASESSQVNMTQNCHNLTQNCHNLTRISSYLAC